MLARPGVVLIIASAVVIAVYASRLTRSSAAHAPAAEEAAAPAPVVAA